MGDGIDELIEEIIVDAYGDDEQLTSFCEVFAGSARFPFRGLVAGVEVDVFAVDYEGDERRGLIALCGRVDERHTVALIEIAPIGPVPLVTRQLLDAYWRWSGKAPFAFGTSSSADVWVYPRFASVEANIDAPLALNPMGAWDPEEAYWGEEGEPIHPLCRRVIAGGARPCFEMDQVIPGADVDDWDSDPIVDAADLHGGGRHRAAIRVLEQVLAIDTRCVDAWGHLGLIAFHTRGAAPALEFYDMGVAIAEASLPAGFGGVLPWTMVDNRPFLRCLQGLALCAWRKRRWKDAEAIFTAQVWLDPSRSHEALACLEPVWIRQRWTP